MFIFLICLRFYSFLNVQQMFIIFHSPFIMINWFWTICVGRDWFLLMWAFRLEPTVWGPIFSLICIKLVWFLIELLLSFINVDSFLMGAYKLGPYSLGAYSLCDRCGGKNSTHLSRNNIERTLQPIGCLRKGWILYSCTFLKPEFRSMIFV